MPRRRFDGPERAPLPAPAAGIESASSPAGHFMREMAGGSYRRSLASTFIPELLSMNLLMTGMVPTMMALKMLLGGGASPTTAAFWFVMSMALLVGSFVAYPMNWWLVRYHLKARHDDGEAQGGVSCRRGVSSQQSRRAGAHGGPGATNEWYGDGCQHAAAATRRRDDPLASSAAAPP
jgi:Domain of unknown function (DUF4396)